ncbi:MAG: ribonuclease P protein subunit [DPANN group archaeon]|jgi:ribonuclease P protein subunit POP4|nr:ribonuclease P protein subunit [DPANN group archaeon]
MALTPINLIKHELIGLHAKVVKSTNASNEGVEGRIVDESYKTITIESNGKDKKIFKENVILIVELPDRKKVQVEGKLLLARPWERIKKKFPKY